MDLPEFFGDEMYPEALFLTLRLYSVYPEEENANLMARHMLKGADDAFREQLENDHDLQTFMQKVLAGEITRDDLINVEHVFSQNLHVQRALRNRFIFGIRQLRDIDALYKSAFIVNDYPDDDNGEQYRQSLSLAEAELKRTIDFLDLWNTTTTNEWIEKGKQELVKPGSSDIETIRMPDIIHMFDLKESAIRMGFGILGDDDLMPGFESIPDNTAQGRNDGSDDSMGVPNMLDGGNSSDESSVAELVARRAKPMTGMEVEAFLKRQEQGETSPEEEEAFHSKMAALDLEGKGKSSS